MADKVAVVTGAARGLGRAFLEALLKRGLKVYFCDIDVEEGKKTQKELRKKFGDGKVHFHECDVRKEKEFAEFFNKAVKTFNDVDIMVNNAGVMQEIDWRNSVDINLNGVIQGSMLAMDHMKQSNGGKGGLIINISSIAGLVRVPYCPVYTATKHGVVAFARSWALHPEVKNNGIRIACLCPSFTDTDIVRNATVQGEELARAVMDKLGLMTTERVTEAFLKLLENKNNNGKVMVVTPTFMDYNQFHDPKL